MNDDYREIYALAERLHYRFRDIVDQPNTSEMQQLRELTKQVVEDIEAGKKPRSIEDRIKAVQQRLDAVRDSGEAGMNSPDAEELYEAYQELREEVRDLPDY